MELLEYILLVIEQIPHTVYFFSVISFCSFSVLILFQKGKKAGRYIATSLLSHYVTLVICSAVFFRESVSDRHYNYQPFWSYLSSEHMDQNIWNIAMFIPIGFLIGYIYKYIKLWEVTLICCSLSIFIELSQFILKRGFSEFDDIMHNTAGAIIGFCILNCIIYFIMCLKRNMSQ